MSLIRAIGFVTITASLCGCDPLIPEKQTTSKWHEANKSLEYRNVDSKNPNNMSGVMIDQRLANRKNRNNSLESSLRYNSQ